MADTRRFLIGSFSIRAAVASAALAIGLAAAAPFDEEVPGSPAAQAEEPPKLALTEPADMSGKALAKAETPSIAPESPSARAIRIITDCQARFRSVKDYTCTFFKRERVDGKLSDMNVMSMKVRNEPYSVYFRFQHPNKGREAIYVHGRNDGLVLAHDVGFTKFLAGTMKLDPNGARAMENCRYPITKAGIGHLIKTVVERWTIELDDRESVVLFDPKMRLGSTPCMLIEAIHPEKKPDFYFHKVRLFIDTEQGVPVRYEAYDWPKKPGEVPELLEEYAYDKIKLNAGLGESDFDASNQLYSFGRF